MATPTIEYELTRPRERGPDKPSALDKWMVDIVEGERRGGVYCCAAEYYVIVLVTLIGWKNILKYSLLELQSADWRFLFKFHTHTLQCSLKAQGVFLAFTNRL